MTGAERVETAGGSALRESISLDYDDSGRVINYLSEIDESNNGSIDWTDEYELTYNDNDSVTFRVLEGGSEYSDMEVNFGSAGIPDGTADMILYTRTIKIPTAMDFNSLYIETANESYKTYTIKEKVPKILHFLYWEDYPGGGVK